jgi:uncharacterized protein (TIGR03435 family)
MSKLVGRSIGKLGCSGALLALIGLPATCRAATEARRESNQRGTLVQLSPPIGPQQVVTLDPHSNSPFVTAKKAQLPAKLVAQVNKPTGSNPPVSVSKPQFEVASIKICTDKMVPAGRSGGRPRWSPGRLSIACATVADLIRWAYLAYPDGKPWRKTVIPGMVNEEYPPVSNRLLKQSIKGSPSWIESDRYWIEAKKEGTSTEATMVGPMMQALLEERFRLKIHKETRELPVYELTVAKGGSKLQVTQQGSCVFADADHPLSYPPPPRICGGITGNLTGWDGYGATMTTLCIVFSDLVDRDVIDKTGITGIFDFHFDVDMALLRSEVSREATTAMPILSERDDDSGGLTDAWRSAFFNAFQSAIPKLGLKLQPAKAMGEFLVIDHVERPSEN